MVQPIITAILSQGTPVTNITPIGIVPKERSKQQDLQSTDHWTMDKSTLVVDFSMILPIYSTETTHKKELAEDETNTDA